MKALVVGSGGREHALVWKLAQECEVFASPGNPGIAEECHTFDVPAHDHHGIRDLARKLEVDFVLVGPEDPLIHGLADTLRSGGINVVGPGGHGALLEGSKAFSKALMREAAIPTAEYQVFTDARDAKDYAAMRFDDGKQVAVKASGAALGKGVVVCTTLSEAKEAIERMLLHEELGEAGRTVVVEDRLNGREYSLLTICSGTSYYSLPVAQDHKRAWDGDRGPNTGGMGAYSPVPWVSPGLVEETEVRVVEPILKLLASKSIDYRGVLFSGMMLDGEDPYCLEFNVRFGDPETQAIMMRLGRGFSEILRACAKGEPLDNLPVLDRSAVGVVVASEGYPGDYRKGVPISIGKIADHVKIFHAGTTAKNGELITNGGRVATVVAFGDSLDEARSRAYGAVEFFSFPGMQYRMDIAAQA